MRCRSGASSELFEGFQIRQQVVNLVRVKLKLRHGRMAGFDAFGQSLAKGLNRVAQMQGSERRRDLERALGYPIDGVAPRAIV